MHACGDVAQSVCYRACGRVWLPPHVWALALSFHVAFAVCGKEIGKEAPCFLSIFDFVPNPSLVLGILKANGSMGG